MAERKYENVWQKMLLEEAEEKEAKARKEEGEHLDYHLDGLLNDRPLLPPDQMKRLDYDFDLGEPLAGPGAKGYQDVDIVVNARRDTRDAIHYIDGLGQFDNVQRRARDLGLTETAAENAYFRRAAFEAANGGPFKSYPPSDHSAQLGLTAGGAIIAPGAGGSVQGSLALNLPDIHNGGDFGLTGTLQAAGGVGGGAYAGTGWGAQAGYAKSVPQTIFSFGNSNYAEGDIGALAVNGSLSANLNDKGDPESIGANKGFGSARIGPSGGAGAFVGKQGQVSVTLTPNTIANILRGKFITLP